MFLQFQIDKIIAIVTWKQTYFSKELDNLIKISTYIIMKHIDLLITVNFRSDYITVVVNVHISKPCRLRISLSNVHKYDVSIHLMNRLEVSAR